MIWTALEKWDREIEVYPHKIRYRTIQCLDILEKCRIEWTGELGLVTPNSGTSTWILCLDQQSLSVTGSNNEVMLLLYLQTDLNMMTSSNENIFRATALCAGNSPATGEFPAPRPVTWSSGVCFDLRLNKRLSEQSWVWWFETPASSLWRHCNE